MAEQKIRLDMAVLERGLSESRAKAGALIMAGQVYVNNQKADKPGMDTVNSLGNCGRMHAWSIWNAQISAI